MSVGPFSVMAVREEDVAARVREAWRMGAGGSIATVNIDILRATTRDSALAELVSHSDIVVADGMPVAWAARMSGHPLPERVTGASLVWTLAEAAAASGRSVYIIGGDPGVPEAAGAALSNRFPGLRVAGTDSPPFGFEKDPEQLAEVVRRARRARPDLVLVGLGFPKQEHLITRLRKVLPDAWMLGCGAGIPFAAGQFRRAPVVLQRTGAEWLFRLAQEPRRLARRYLAHDLPFALALLGRAALGRLGGATQATRPALVLRAGLPPVPVQTSIERLGPVRQPSPVRALASAKPRPVTVRVPDDAPPLPRTAQGA
ncbi:WecB/TagA/CpsF family glycosyltransferase [Blastococcus sp. TF02-09]|uniref:WecB/TagA/CpsF family glycosyltransferase n=1 Tax=Blastococcus sp. TF02-09 TaxID=2250576 RepID=UPI0018F38EF9|nr:WecB/TagA/CpsF family glycosyltransferase [Blastococcus sp. TF02-9]